MKIKPRLLTTLLALAFLSPACKKDKDEKDYFRATIKGNTWEASSIVVDVDISGEPTSILAVSGEERITLRLLGTEVATYPFKPYTANDVQPAVLLSFTGATVDAGHQLDWTTNNETDTKHFIVETSDDGINWLAVATIPALGTGGGNYTYTYTETQSRVKSYYRLKMVDTDDRFSYSSIRVINMAYQTYYEPAGGVERGGYDGYIQIVAVNKEKRFLSGSFSFKITDIGGTEHTISAGSFRLHY